MVDRPFFLTLLAFGLLVLYVYLVLIVLAPFGGALIGAAVLGIATFPLYRRLRRRLKGRSTLAASLMTPAVVLLLTVPVLLIILFLAVELDALYDTIQIRILTGDHPTLRRMGEWAPAATLREFLRPITQDFQLDLKEALTPALQNIVAVVVERSQKIAQGVVLLALQGAVMILTLFFFFRDGEKLLDLFSSLIPLPEDRKALLLERTREILSAVLYGVFLTALVQGNLAFIGYWMVDLPSPVLLAIVTAFASIVPPVGTALVWVPAALYLLFSGDAPKGILLLAWGSLVVSTSDNFIRPYFICGRGRVPFLTVLLGILGGLAAFGLAGMVIGPILLALFFSIADLYRPLLPESEGRIIPPG